MLIFEKWRYQPAPILVLGGAPVMSTMNLAALELWQVFHCEGDTGTPPCGPGELKEHHLRPLFLGLQSD